MYVIFPINIQRKAYSTFTQKYFLLMHRYQCYLCRNLVQDSSWQARTRLLWIHIYFDVYIKYLFSFEPWLKFRNCQNSNFSKTKYSFPPFKLLTVKSKKDKILGSLTSLSLSSYNARGARPWVSESQLFPLPSEAFIRLTWPVMLWCLSGTTSAAPKC